MKVFQVALFALSASTSLATSSLRVGDEERKLVIANCPGSAGDFSVRVAGTCNDAGLQTAINDLKATEFTSCTANAATILNDLLGTNNNNRAAKVETICRTAYEDPDFNFSFDDVTLEGYQFNNEYFSGGGSWNYEIETDSGDNVLRQDAARVNKIYQNEAVEKAITLPMDLPAFNPSDADKCELNAAFCCWVQDRQARDNNGNCGKPYSTNCVDRDPGDNANLCYVEHEKAAVATHMAGGFSIYGEVKRNKENIEGPVHCHGFAWAEDDLDSISVFKGNNLFYVSMYDHLHQRGYVRNVPGATMCACAENMPVVTRSDCTQVDVELAFEFNYDSGNNAMTAKVDVTDFEYNACQGANNKNNDLEAYYKKLVNTGKATQANLAKLQQILVGAGGKKCDAAIESFLASKGIVLK